MFDIVVAKASCSKSLYYLSSNEMSFNKGDVVVIETDLGDMMGVVVKGNYSEKEENLILPLKKVIRKATEDDIATCEKLDKEAEEALSYSKKVAKELELDMSFVDSQFNLDKSVLIITYLSDNRIDFRELAKKIAGKYKARIELRQIGVRDKSKRLGGLGPCGLFLCCNSFLSDFNSVSINMAKNQGLALSPTKINGVCGRLLCCLGYENEVYSELKAGLPKVGMNADTPGGMGKVVSVDILKGTYKVDLKEKGIIEFSKEDK